MAFNNMERKDSPSLSIRQLYSKFGSLPFFMVIGEFTMQRVVWIRVLAGEDNRPLITPRAIPDSYDGRGQISLKSEVRVMLESPICEEPESWVLWLGGQAARAFQSTFEDFDSGLTELDRSIADALVPSMVLTAEKSKYSVVRVQLSADSLLGLGGEPRIKTSFTPFGYLSDASVENSSVFEKFKALETRIVTDLADCNFDKLQKHTILSEGQTYVDRSVWYDCRVNMELILNGYAKPEQAFTDPANFELLKQAHEKYVAQENLMVAATELLS